MATDTIKKVTVFVISEESPSRILLFRHPLAGIQLPAGTVEPGEEILDAARREVWEETGLKVMSQGKVLGSRTEELEENQVVMMHDVRTARLDRCDDVKATFCRGHKAWVIGSRPGEVHLKVETYDYNATPPLVSSSIEGWVDAGAVVDSIERTFVVFKHRGNTNDSWERYADGHVFQVFWTECQEASLVEGQQSWLDDHIERLIHPLE